MMGPTESKTFSNGVLGPLADLATLSELAPPPSERVLTLIPKTYLYGVVLCVLRHRGNNHGVHTAALPVVLPLVSAALLLS